MTTWIDDKGRLRESEDERHQLLAHIPTDFLDPWLSYDSWTAELAVRLITLGCNIDIERYWEEARTFPEGSIGLDRGWAFINVCSRGVSIAQSTIAAGLLKNPDTPANWLAWAERKGYDVSHLKQADVESQASPERTSDEPQTAPAGAMDVPAKKQSSTAAGPRFSMKKAALVKAHIHEWPTIERDIQDASTNGLHAAKAVHETGLKNWQCNGQEREADFNPSQNVHRCFRSLRSA